MGSADWAGTTQYVNIWQGQEKNQFLLGFHQDYFYVTGFNCSIEVIRQECMQMQLRQYNQTRKALSDAQETIDRLMKTVFDAELQLKLSQAQVHAHEALVVVTRPDNLD